MSASSRRSWATRPTTWTAPAPARQSRLPWRRGNTRPTSWQRARPTSCSATSRTSPTPSRPSPAARDGATPNPSQATHRWGRSRGPRSNNAARLCVAPRAGHRRLDRRARVPGPRSRPRGPPRRRSPPWVGRCGGPQHRPEASSQRGDAEVARDSVALGDEDGGERDTVLSPPPLALELRFSSDVDPLLPLGARGRLQRLEHVVHVALELLDRPEA